MIMSSLSEQDREHRAAMAPKTGPDQARSRQRTCSLAAIVGSLETPGIGFVNVAERTA
jgi:hypothetical protein